MGSTALGRTVSRVLALIEVGVGVDWVAVAWAFLEQLAFAALDVGRLDIVDVSAYYEMRVFRSGMTFYS